MPQPPAPLRRVVALPHALFSNKRDNSYTTSMMPSWVTPRLCRRGVVRALRGPAVGRLPVARDLGSAERVPPLWRGALRPSHARARVVPEAQRGIVLLDLRL